MREFQYIGIFHDGKGRLFRMHYFASNLGLAADHGGQVARHAGMIFKRCARANPIIDGKECGAFVPDDGIKPGDTVRLRNLTKRIGKIEGRQDHRTAVVRAVLEDGGLQMVGDLNCCRYWNVDDVEFVK